MRYIFLLSIVFLWSCSAKEKEEHIKNKKTAPATDKKSDQADDQLQLSDQQIQLGNISVDTMRSGSTANQTVLTAVLNFDQSKTSAISSRVMGRVDLLYFKNIGDYVSSGSKLYEIYSEELNNAKEEYLLIVRSRNTLIGNSAVDYNSLVQSSQNKLKLWGMSSAQITQLVRSGIANSTTTVYSTGSGYITVLDVRQGDYVMEGGTIVQLADLSAVWAEAQVFTTQFSQLQQNASVTVRIPELGDEEINGTISFVNPEIVPQSGINLIRVAIPNKDNKLKPGMQAYVYLSNSNTSSFTLPVDAVIRDSKGAAVWIKTGKNTFQTKMVTVGAEANSRIEIMSGLQPGDLVVVTGSYLLNSEYIFKKGTNPMEGMKM